MPKIVGHTEGILRFGSCVYVYIFPFIILLHMCRSWRTTHEFFTTCGPHDRAQAIRLAQKCSLAQLAVLLALFNFFGLPYRVMSFIIALVVFVCFVF